METRDALRSVVENILKPEQEECLVHVLNGGDVVALLPTGFGKSLIYQLLPIISEKLGRPKVIIVIVSPLVALMDDQVKEAAKHSLGCTMIQKSGRGISALYLASPNPGFSIQNGELCWHQPYTKTTSSSTKHMSHTNGEFGY